MFVSEVGRQSEAAQECGACRMTVSGPGMCYGRGAPAKSRRHDEMRISFWLLPADPARTVLSGFIRRLAVRYEGPVFAPHVTLYSAPLVESLVPESIVRSVARTCLPFTLEPSSIGHSRQFTKTLFATLASTAALEDLHRRIRSMCGSLEYDLQPHLSLLYASVTHPEREALAKTTPLPGRLLFDSIDAIITPDETRDRADVESWRYVGEQKLSGAGRK